MQNNISNAIDTCWSCWEHKCRASSLVCAQVAGPVRTFILGIRTRIRIRVKKSREKGVQGHHKRVAKQGPGECHVRSALCGDIKYEHDYGIRLALSAVMTLQLTGLAQSTQQVQRRSSRFWGATIKSCQPLISPHRRHYRPRNSCAAEGVLPQRLRG